VTIRVRIDKYIWCVRLKKTRSLASKEVNADKVKLNGAFVKGSKDVSIGHTIALKHGPVWKTYEILDIPKSRVGAKLVPELIKETTPWADLELLESIEQENRLNRLQGLRGRPTKRDRRDLDQFKGDG